MSDVSGAADAGRRRTFPASDGSCGEVNKSLGKEALCHNCHKLEGATRGRQSGIYRILASPSENRVM